MRGNLAVPGGSLTSKPTWSHTSGCSTTSDRKSTRLNSSHPSISYAVFCLKKKIFESADALDRSTFWQIYRGTIINVRHIAGLTRDYGGRLRGWVRAREETLAVSASEADPC